MLQEQFYFRLLLIIGLGIIYVRTMMTMGQYKPVEEIKKKNIIMKIIGSVFSLFGLFGGFVCIYILTQIQHPTEMILPTISPDGIIRSSAQQPIWGYATFAQQQIISYMSNCMLSLGLGAYFLFYRKSDSKWWQKILKFVYGLLLYTFYVSATNFHYFDIYEWIPFILFCIMSFYVNKRKRLPPVTTSQEAKCGIPNITIEPEKDTTTDKENEMRFMPKEMVEEVVDVNEINDADAIETENPESPIHQATPVYSFCRYCGKKIDYEGIKYCKHCGKLII